MIYSVLRQMAEKKNTKQKQTTGVSLDRPVIEYLDEVAEREERNRSFVINRIVREHAKRRGKRLD